ncbi:MAG: 3-oxoacyl-ACP synthase [Acidobacteria bacterium RIFCSPLOWO2_02_FULL_59_13]|nr:MAG: 3-oxoacyl-ACP synthase [Acidobacteria bacterium RIFCSPLOWO2_02_FULL_59_13]
MRRAKITALGCYTPPRLLTNQDLEKMVDTSDTWIRERTGVAQRHIVDKGVATSDLAHEACIELFKQRQLNPKEVQAIIVATVTPDTFFPSTACTLQNRLGIQGAWGFDLSAACCGFVFALTTGAQFIASGLHDKVLVVGADVMSSIINYEDRATCVIFGDGAGAVLLEPAEPGEDAGILDYIHEIDGSGGAFLQMPAGGSRLPSSIDTVRKKLHYVHQDGPQVFKYAVRKMYEISQTILERNSLTARDLDVYIPHQANRRIIEATAERLGLGCDKVLINIDRYGNTTAATIPLAAADAIQQGKLKKGGLALFAAAGAGYTAGAVLLRWAY